MLSFLVEQLGQGYICIIKKINQQDPWCRGKCKILVDEKMFILCMNTTEEELRQEDIISGT